MICFDNYTYARRFERRHDGVGKLAREAFLKLRTASENLQGTGQLREADDAAIGDIAHVRDAMERQKVVFAHTIEGDILNDDHLLMALLEPHL
jgi:hypothetical protein